MEVATKVTVGVRFHDISYLPLLKRCLLSISAQQGVDLSLIVCTQGFSPGQIEDVGTVCERFANHSVSDYKVRNVDNPKRLDLRAQLLNSIIEQHYDTGRATFLAFMDYDDIWFSHALKTLLEPFTYGPFAMSYADVHCADVFYQNGMTYLRDVKDVFDISQHTKANLFTKSFLPLHSYMFDTSMINKSDLYYDTSFEVLEDYDLLVSLARKYPVSGLRRGELIGLYNFYTSPNLRINTTGNILSQDGFQRSDVWNQ